jgi:hypothetical protein
VNSLEKNKENFCNGLDGKPLFSTVYGIYTVTLYELKTILKVNAKAGQNGVVNKTSVEPMAQGEDFQEVKRCKSLIIPHRQRRSRLDQS